MSKANKIGMAMLLTPLGLAVLDMIGLAVRYHFWSFITVVGVVTYLITATCLLYQE